jgi:regulator of replication initiation timing
MPQPTTAKPCAELLQYYQDQWHECQERLVDREALKAANLKLVEENERLRAENEELYRRLAELEKKRSRKETDGSRTTGS